MLVRGADESMPCRKEANLVTADTTIKFMMDTYDNENADITREMLTVLELCYVTQANKFITGSSVFARRDIR